MDGPANEYHYVDWYAPEVGHMIKERTRFSYGIRERELTGFKFAERPQ